MSNAALQQADAVTITDHAIERRLCHERATEEEISRVFDSYRGLAEEVIRNEVEGAIELSPDAMSLFRHPGRQAAVGLAKSRVYFDRSGRRRISTGFRTNEDRYLWSGDVIYVVDHQVVVTCILPDRRQIMTLFSLMPRAGSLLGRMTSILVEMRGPGPGRLTIVPPSGGMGPAPEVRRRESPSIAEWRSDSMAIWTVIVAGEGGAAVGLEERAVDEIEREAKKGVPIFIERTADKSIERIARKIEGFIQAKSLPKLPEIEWAEVNGKIPRPMKEWWHEMAEAGKPVGRLVTVMTSGSAKSLLETANGSSDAGWRKDESCCRPGSKINLIFGEDSVIIGRDWY